MFNFSDLSSFYSLFIDSRERILSLLLDIGFNAFDFFYNIFFGWINIPDFPQDLEQALYSFLDLIFDNLGLLSFFVRFSTLKVLIPTFLIAFSFNLIRKHALWALKKIINVIGILK